MNIKMKIIAKTVALLVFITSGSVILTGCGEEKGNSVYETSGGKDNTTNTSGTYSDIKSLELLEAYLTTNTEESNLYVDSDNAVIYAGYARLVLSFNQLIDSSISGYIYINDQKINPKYVEFEGTTARIYLSRDLPQKYTLSIMKEYAVDNSCMESDYCLNFIHHPQLCCKIYSFDKGMQKIYPAAIYLTEQESCFLFRFNKPVDKNNLSFISELNNDNYEVAWLSENEFILTLKTQNLYNNRVGLENAYGMDSVFGNKLMKEFDENNHYQHTFSIIKPQNIYSINPETNEISTLCSLKYGSIYESMSPNAHYLSLGIILDNTEGHHYTKTLLDINNFKQDMINPLIEESISRLEPGKVVKLPETRLYNPLIGNNYWDYFGNYIYLHDGHLYKMDPQDHEISLFYESNNDDRYIIQHFSLNNGNMAIIENEPVYNGKLFLILVDSQGRRLEEYELPFRMKTGEGWFLYASNVVDARNQTILVSGYEFAPGKESMLSTYSLDLSDGSTSLMSEGETLLGHYPDPGFSIYRNSDLILRETRIDIVSLEGELLHSIIHDEDLKLCEFLYNPVKKMFHTLSFNYKDNRYTIMNFDPVTFELLPSSVSFAIPVRMIGVLPDGNILAIDEAPSP